MGLLSGILGNASKANTNHVEQELQKILLPNEDIEYAYSLVRDIIAFTKYRMIVVDKQGVTGKKISYRTIPYKSISRVEVETAGNFDLDAELKIWVSSGVEPVESLEFSNDSSIYEIQQVLALAVLTE